MIGRPPISPLFPPTPLSRSPFAMRTRLEIEAEGRRVLKQVTRLLVDADERAALAALEAVGEELQPERRLRSEEHTSELQSQSNLVCRLLLEKKNKTALLHVHHLLPHDGAPLHVTIDARYHVPCNAKAHDHLVTCKNMVVHSEVQRSQFVTGF